MEKILAHQCDNGGTTEARTTRILFVEDNPSDSELAERELRKNGLEYSSTRVDTEEDFRASLDAYAPDIVISDYSMPSFDGMKALLIAKERAPFLPFIILTGAINEETAVSCMKAGASDYVIKEHMSRLAYAVREALERKTMQEKAALQEEMIRLSEERYRSIFVDSNAVMLIIDPDDLKVVDANKSAVEFYGWPRETLIGTAMNDINTLSPARLKEKVRKAMSLEENHFQFEHRTADGRVIEVESHTKPISIAGKTYLFSIIHDISERIAAERDRDALAIRLKHYLSTSPTVTYSMRLENGSTRMEWISENVTELLGYPPDEPLRPEWWFKNVFIADRMRAMGGVTELTKSGYFSQDYRFYRKDRSILWLHDEMRLSEQDGGSYEIVGTFTDISERKRVEEEIYLKGAALEAADNAVVITDRNAVIEWVNSAFEKLTGYGSADAIGKNVGALVNAGKQDAEFYRGLWDTIVSGHVWRGTLVNRKKNGDLYNEEMTITPVVDAFRRIEHFIAIKSDITERTNVQERIQASLREKEILLREIHHRVNNNMQVISSLINLTSENILAKPVRSNMEELIRRIEAMAIVHEQFYRSIDVSRIDFSRYLRQLAATIVNENHADTKKPELVFEADDVTLTLEEAIPAGLIVSECVSNSLRFAFAESVRPARITIKLKRRMGDYLEVEVRDNGVGLPPEFEPKKSTSLGMRLIGILSDQLGGATEFRIEGGTVALLRFPLVPVHHGTPSAA